MLANKPLLKIEYFTVNKTCYRLIANYSSSVKSGNSCPNCHNQIRAAMIESVTHQKTQTETFFKLLSPAEIIDLLPFINREYCARQTFCVYCASINAPL